MPPCITCAAVPTVEMGGLGEVGVAAQQDCPEAGESTEMDRVVDHGVSAFVTRTVAGRLMIRNGSPVLASETINGW